MSRQFANGLANFIVEGNLVSFTFTDQRSDGQGKPLGQPSPVADIVMREGDFAQMVSYLSQALQHMQQRKGGAKPQRPQPQGGGLPLARPGPSAKLSQPADRPPLGPKITPGR